MTPSPQLQSELSLLEWLRGQPGTGGYLGDDAAVLPSLNQTVVTVDCQTAGTHVPLDIEPAVFARRLLAVNLSDIASMGARPRFAFLALAAPRDFAFRGFFEAFLQAISPTGLVLAGGDLCSSTLLTATLTLIGDQAPGSEWLKRSTATPDQALWLGGTLGESAVGCRLAALGGRLHGDQALLPKASPIPTRLRKAAQRALRRHFEPTPQLDLGLWLATQDSAATDVSDGLARDLHHLCRASDVGARVLEEDLPRTPQFGSLAQHLGMDPLEVLLGGGEDYVLLFTLPPTVVPPKRFGCHRIGETTLGTDLFIHDHQGREEPLEDLGWDHLENSGDRPSAATETA